MSSPVAGTLLLIYSFPDAGSCRGSPRRGAAPAPMDEDSTYYNFDAEDEVSLTWL